MALTDDLKAYWKHDESSGSNVPDIVNGHHGTTTGSPTWETGLIGNALLYSTGDKTNIPDHADWDAAAFSISLWVKPSTKGYLFDRYGIPLGTGDRFIIGIQPNPYTVIIQSNIGGNYDRLDSNGGITLNVWTHIVAVYNGTNIKMYVNSILQNDQESQTGTFSSTRSIELMWDGATTTSGLMDEVGFWARALEQSEITELYNSGDGLTYPFTTGTNTQINIGDVWKEIPEMQINIGDVWKDVVGAQINIGDTWKEVFA